MKTYDDLLNQIVELASANDAFRRELASTVRMLGGGHPRRKIPTDEVFSVASAVARLRSECSGDQAWRVQMPTLFEEIGKMTNLSRAKVKDRYYRAKEMGLDLGHQVESVRRGKV